MARLVRGRPPQHKRRGGFTLVETLVASAILAFALVSATAAMMFVRRAVVANNLRSVALFNAQRTLEALRVEGAAKLGGLLAYNGAPDNEFLDAWEADAVAAGLAEPEIQLRGVFRFDEAAGEYQLAPGEGVFMSQRVSLVSNGSEEERFERAIRAYVDVEWRFGGKVHAEALFTVIY